MPGQNWARRVGPWLIRVGRCLNQIPTSGQGCYWRTPRSYLITTTAWLELLQGTARCDSKAKVMNKHLLQHVTAGTCKLPEVLQTFICRGLWAKEIMTNGLLTFEPPPVFNRLALGCRGALAPCCADRAGDRWIKVWGFGESHVMGCWLVWQHTHEGGKKITPSTL